MIPNFIKQRLDHWTTTKLYGEVRIVFQNGVIQRWTETVSKLPPSNKGSEPSINSGVTTTETTASQGIKLEDTNNG